MNKKISKIIKSKIWTIEKKIKKTPTKKEIKKIWLKSLKKDIQKNTNEKNCKEKSEI